MMSASPGRILVVKNTFLDLPTEDGEGFVRRAVTAPAYQTKRDGNASQEEAGDDDFPLLKSTIVEEDSASSRESESQKGDNEDEVPAMHTTVVHTEGSDSNIDSDGRSVTNRSGSIPPTVSICREMTVEYFEPVEAWLWASKDLRKMPPAAAGPATAEPIPEDSALTNTGTSPVTGPLPSGPMPQAPLLRPQNPNSAFPPTIPLPTLPPAMNGGIGGTTPDGNGAGQSSTNVGYTRSYVSPGQDMAAYSLPPGQGPLDGYGPAGMQGPHILYVPYQASQSSGAPFQLPNGLGPSYSGDAIARAMGASDPGALPAVNVQRDMAVLALQTAFDLLWRIRRFVQ